jgi:hypothetical protein
MRVLICGDRNWNQVGPILDALMALDDVTLVIDGAAKGADTIGNTVAKAMDLPTKRFPAKWEQYGKKAGPIRNGQMLTEGKPDLVLAFHNDITKSKGTRDMLKRCIKAGVPFALYPAGQDSNI